MSDVTLTAKEREALHSDMAPWEKVMPYNWLGPEYGLSDGIWTRLDKAVERILTARLADRDAAGVEARVRIILKHTPHLGAGGNLWNARCLGCDWRDGGRGDINFASRAHARHVAAALSSPDEAAAVGTTGDGVGL